MARVLFLLIISYLSIQLCFSQEKDLTKERFLIVLDIQEYYTKDKLSEENAQKLIDSVNYVIDNSNNVVYVKSTHKLLNLSLSYPFIYVSFDTSAMRLDKRMYLVNDHIFTKENCSAFTVKDLRDFLKQNNAKEIVIIGLMAEDCIYESLIEGKELGFDMYIIPEAIIGESQNEKEKAIKALIKEGVKILDIKMLNNEKSSSKNDTDIGRSLYNNLRTFVCISRKINFLSSKIRHELSV